MVRIDRGAVARALKVERREDGQLWVEKEGREHAVRVQRCFPWSEPVRYLSLRDDDNEEVALVPCLSALEPGSRDALASAVAEAGFVLEITGIEHVDEEVEIRTWSVTTRQGPRRFQTRLDDWPVEVPGGGIVIKDVAGDLYHVPDPEALDARTRGWLWAFVD